MNIPTFIKNYNIFNKKVDFDKASYNFCDLIQNIFNHKLDDLHTITTKEYPLFTELGKDTHTDLHKTFYNYLDNKDDGLQKLYNNLIKDVIFPYLNLDQGLYQVFPTFRVMLPNNVAIVKKHYDSDQDHHHPKGEINFVLALTDMYDTNSIWAESYPRLEDFKPFTLNAGDIYDTALITKEMTRT